MNAQHQLNEPEPDHVRTTEPGHGETVGGGWADRVLAGAVLTVMCCGLVWLAWAWTSAGDLAWVYYLNWNPAAFSIVSFAFDSLVSKLFAGAAVLVGAMVCVRHGSTAPSLAALGMALLFLGFDGPRGRLLSYQLGLAQVECIEAGSVPCRLNAMHRAYDLGLSVDETNSVWEHYTALRGETLPRPDDPTDRRYRIELDLWNPPGKNALMASLKDATPHSPGHAQGR